jgi:hypothetical protein
MKVLQLNTLCERLQSFRLLSETVQRLSVCVVCACADAIQGDRDVVIFNPIASSILKWLRFKVLRRMHYLHHSALLSNGLGQARTAGVTMETKACGLVQSTNDKKALLA